MNFRFLRAHFQKISTRSHLHFDFRDGGEVLGGAMLLSDGKGGGWQIFGDENDNSYDYNDCDEDDDKGGG